MNDDEIIFDEYYNKCNYSVKNCDKNSLESKINECCSLWDKEGPNDEYAVCLTELFEDVLGGACDAKPKVKVKPPKPKPVMPPAPPPETQEVLAGLFK